MAGPTDRSMAQWAPSDGLSPLDSMRLCELKEVGKQSSELRMTFTQGRVVTLHRIAI